MALEPRSQCFFDLNLSFQANIINRFGGVKIEKIRGLRVPFLKPGWNRQFLMMKEFGFVYDSSIPAPLSDPPIWPYTLDFKIPHKCIGRRMCPSRSFPGLWVTAIIVVRGLLCTTRQQGSCFKWGSIICRCR